MFMPRLLGAVGLVGIVAAAIALAEHAAVEAAAAPSPGCGRTGAASRGSPR